MVKYLTYLFLFLATDNKACGKKYVSRMYVYYAIEQKGMTFDYEFGYFFLFPPKKRGKKKRRMN